MRPLSSKGQIKEVHAGIVKKSKIIISLPKNPLIYIAKEGLLPNKRFTNVCYRSDKCNPKTAV